MLRRILLLMLGVALVQSCGQDGGGDGGGARAMDADQAFTLTTGAVAVTLAPGAVVAGTSLTLNEVPQPNRVAGFTGVTPASVAALLSAKDAAGAAVTTFAALATVTMKVEPKPYGLTAVTRPDELCAVLITPDGATALWRRADLGSVDADSGKVVFTTQRLGTFQLAWCGSAEIPGATSP